MSLLSFFRKKRLASKGLSCGKTRRSAGEGDLADLLEKSPWIRAGIILAAAGLLCLLTLGAESAAPLKDLLYALLILAVVIVHPLVARGGALSCNSRLALFLTSIFVQLGISSLLLGEVGEGRLDNRFLCLLAPYALAPLTISVLLGPQNGFWAALVAGLWWTILRGQSDAAPLLFALTGGMTAVLTTLRVRRRSRLLRAGLYSGLSVCLLGIVTGQINPASWDPYALQDWRALLLGGMIPLAVGVMTAVLVSGSLPLLERLFRVTTDISWLEMADLNHPLLKRLSLEAPGTYHHSLALANLAESCAEKTGANASLCRVGAYFHDIGKLAKPEYFAENVSPGDSPHDTLTPSMSALVILSHVKEGVDLGLRHQLNGRVVDMIRQHHGTTLVEYFYRRARQQEQDARAGGTLLKIRDEDIPRVSEENFRYPGPKPQTLEAVILGLADAAESASRSLDRPTQQRLDDLVHDLLQDRLDDGQYDEAPVTVAQLHTIAETLVSSLSSMHHIRVAYRRSQSDQGGGSESLTKG